MEKPFILFDDYPKEEIGSEDAFRIGSVVDALAEQVQEALRQKGRGRRLRVGLFAGLGQGKSTVICALERRLKKSRFVRFDIALHKSELLEYEFDRLVGRWNANRLLKGTLRVIVSVLVVVFGAMLWMWGRWITSVGDAGAFWAELFDFAKAVFASPAISWVSAPLLGLVGMWKPWIFLLREWESEWNFGDQGLMWKKIKQCLSPPDVLVIDNLDRATVEQQRAILRAVYKFGDRLNYPVIIVLDEWELLQPAKPGENDFPQDLLRKVVQLEMRLPLRTSEDMARIVLSLADEGYHNQKGNDSIWRNWLRSPQLLGDWVRTFSLLPNTGPRRIKHFFNNLLSTCQELALQHPEDGAAMTRLLMLYELHPILRTSPAETMVDALAANDLAKFKELLKHVGVDSLPRASEIFFTRTRHMRPRDGSWRNLVRRLAGRDKAVPVIVNRDGQVQPTLQPQGPQR